MLHIQKNVSLAQYTTFCIGGPAEYFVEVDSKETLREAIAWAQHRGHVITVLGGGSNVLVSDDGIAGLVIKNSVTGITYDEESDTVRATVGAGVAWDDFVQQTVEKKLWGIENLSGIPGSVGATPIQNVGAYGVEVGNVIQAIEVFDTTTGTFTMLTPLQCSFAYRHSMFKETAGKKYIVAAVTFCLHKNGTPNLSYADLENYFGTNTPTLSQIRTAVLEIRARKFPDLTKVGTAGSFFKNPILPNAQFDALKKKFPRVSHFPVSATEVKVSLGWILDNVCGLKGYTEGNVSTYRNQALVVVNNGNASAKEITAFAQTISEKVFEKTRIRVEWEVTRV